MSFPSNPERAIIASNLSSRAAAWLAVCQISPHARIWLVIG